MKTNIIKKLIHKENVYNITTLIANWSMNDEKYSVNNGSNFLGYV